MPTLGKSQSVPSYGRSRLFRYFQKKYALDDAGTVLFFKAIFWTTVFNLFLMFSASIIFYFLYEFVGALEQKNIPQFSFWIYIGGIIIITILIAIFSSRNYHASFFATYEAGMSLRIRLAEIIRKLPLSFFGKQDPTTLANTLMKDTTTLEMILSHSLPKFYGSLLSTFLIIFGLLFFDWRMGLTTLSVLPLALLVLFCSKKRQETLNRKFYKSLSRGSSLMQVGIENIEDITSFNLQDSYTKELSHALDVTERAQLKGEAMTGTMVNSAQMILIIGIALIMLVGSILYIKSDIPLFVFIAFLIVASRIYFPFQDALVNIALLFSASLPVERMQAIEAHIPQTGSTNPDIKNYTIEFENVSFGYKNQNDVIKNASFVVPQGKITALVGLSGSGKSTLAKLAIRFWDPREGTIRLGGVDITTIDPETLFHSYTMVFQDVVLFNESVLKNISIGKRGASEDEIREAARLARCDDFIQKLPQGYATLVGENGALLSGGECQRISIARAILKDAPIVILDEATAALDMENESAIQEALSGLIQNKTVLVIAHRLRTIEKADNIIVVHHGQILEQGTHSVLMENNEMYKNLYTLQKESEQWSIKTAA